MSYYAFMPNLFNMSLTASVAIALVILLRLLLKKAPKVISYALWGVVLFRLLCPVSIGSSFSLYNLFDAPTEESGTMISVIEYVPTDIVHTEYPSVVLPVPGVSDVINEALPQGQEQLAADPLEAPMSIATYIWMTGVLVMVIYSIVSYIRLRRKLSVVVPLRDNIFIADDIKSPFVVGLFRPKIYLPCNLGAKEQEYIILHEQRHIKRLDHIAKASAFLALAIHWFNPLVWVAFILASKDMEMSCDEAVIRKAGSDVRADYSASLLTLATGRRIIAGTPLAFGEGDTKGRINNLSKWKKPAVWVVLLAVIACVVLAVCLLTNPSEDKLHAPEPFCHSYRVGKIMYQDIRYSFGYTMDTAPRYSLTPDYQMFVAGDTFDGSDSGEWVQHYGAFKETKLSGLRFDGYFKDLGNLSEWDGARYGAESIREQTKQAWRLDVDDSENGVFYYLILTHTDKVFLCYGYDVGETHAEIEENSLIRWVFELERTDLLTCNAVSDGMDAFVELAYFPNEIDRDTNNWPVAQINEAGALKFTVDADTNALVVSEEYYARNGDAVEIDKNSFEVGRGEDGFFTIDIARRGSLNDYVKYYIKIKGQSDVYAMKVVFKEDDSTSNTDSVFELQENTVAEIGRGTLKTAVELMDEDAASLLSLIESGNWKEGIPDCVYDCAINLGGRLIYYHSECGTFIEYDLSKMSLQSHTKNHAGQHCKLSEADQIAVNNILNNYIDLLNGITDIAPAGLNLATLKDLVQTYGEDLTWDHFAAYHGEDVGSGLYIMRFEIIDVDCYLMIGGASMELAPMYIKLVSANDPDHFIDVRYEDIEDFLSSFDTEKTMFLQDAVKITRADFPIFDGPSYDHSYVAVVQSAGVYTVIEKQTDSEGNTWGKLKSGVGWVDLTKAQAEENTQPPITAMLVNDDLLNGKDYHEYMADDSEYAVKILFSAAETLTDVRFSSLQHENGTFAIAEELDSVSELNPENPFVAGVVFYGDMTTYGISFTDASGVERSYMVYISGRNGALMLEEY